MDRLTMDTTGKTGIGLTFDLDVSCANMDTAERLQDLIIRLGQLEKAVSDADGKYDLDRLRALAEADRDGRCVLLPCKPGTPIYTTRWWDNVDEEYTDSKGITFYRTNMKHKVTKEKFFPFGLDYTEFGKTVFLTRAEAEATLAKEDKQA